MNETMTTVVGNVITEVKQRRIADGTRVASFRMASNERRFDKETQLWVNGDSLFVTVTCWRKLALGVTASLMKGDPVVVTGRLFTRGYEVEGQKRSVTELEAAAVGPDLARCIADVSRARRQATEDVPVEISMTDDPRCSTEAPGAGGPAGADGGIGDTVSALPTQQERLRSDMVDGATEPGPQLAVVGSA